MPKGEPSAELLTKAAAVVDAQNAVNPPPAPVAEDAPVPDNVLNLDFTKRPVTIQAVQLTTQNWNSVCELVGPFTEGMSGVYIDAEGNPTDTFPGDGPEGEPCKIGLTIPTLEGVMLAKEGDWIIKGVKGEIYPCKPDIFEATYSPATVPETPPELPPAASVLHLIENPVVPVACAPLVVARVCKLQGIPTEKPRQAAFDERGKEWVCQELDGDLVKLTCAGGDDLTSALSKAEKLRTEVARTKLAADTSREHYEKSKGAASPELASKRLEQSRKLATEYDRAKAALDAFEALNAGVKHDRLCQLVNYQEGQVKKHTAALKKLTDSAADWDARIAESQAKFVPNSKEEKWKDDQMTCARESLDPRIEAAEEKVRGAKADLASAAKERDSLGYLPDQGVSFTVDLTKPLVFA